MTNANLAKKTRNRWITKTVSLMISEVMETDTEHSILVEHKHSGLSLTLCVGPFWGENAVRLAPYEARNRDYGELCAEVALAVADLAVAEPYPSIPVALTSTERDLVASGRVIQAIKEVRLRFQAKGVSLGLKDAKDSVDVYRREIGTYPEH